MATENIDGVEFSVDVDTSGAISSTKKIESQTKKIEKSFKGVDTQVTKTAKGVGKAVNDMAVSSSSARDKIESLAVEFAKAEKELSEFTASTIKAGRTISSNGVVLNKFGNESKSATEKLATLRKRHSALSDSTQKFTKNTKVAGRVAQNFSYQIQDVAVQLAGGQQPALIFAQQFPQMAVGMGAAAAGIGALVAILGGLYLAFGDSKSNLEKFESSVERLKATLTLSAEGVAEYSDQMKRLNLISKQLVETQLRATIGEQEKAFKLGAKALREYTQDATSFTRGFSSFADRVKELTGKDLGEDGFDRARSSLVRFTKEVTLFSLNPTEDSVRSLSNALVDLEKDGASTTEKGRLLISETLKQVQAFNEGKITIKELNKALKDNDEITDSTTAKTIKHKKSVNDLVESVKQEALTHNFNARALALYVAVQQGATQEQINSINASYDKIDALDAEIKATKDKATKEKQIAQKAEKERLKNEAARNTLSGKVQGLGLSQEDQIRATLDSELELLRLAQEQKIEIEGSYEERRVELRRKAEERIRAINEKSTQESSINFEALENQIVGTFASVASGAQSGKEAVRSLAQSIATQLIGSLIKMGIQAAIGQTTAAATGVATAATLSAAYATPAALASLASFGSNAAPAAAGIASTVGLAQGLSLAGGRESGGPVTKGRLYEVGEKNKPEMLQSGGKQYMIPGNNGNVISNKDLNSSSGGIQVIINNNAPGVSVSATESSDSDGRMRQIAIQVVSEQSAALGSELNRNINKNHNVTNRQGANRRN